MTSPRDAAAALMTRYQRKAAPPDAFAVFTGDQGRAWLIEGPPPRGYIDAGDDGDEVEYTDLAAWQAEVERLGIQTPEATAPDEQQTPEQPAADEPAATPEQPAPEQPAAETPAAAPTEADLVEDDGSPGEPVLAPDLITGDPGGQIMQPDYDQEEGIEDDAEANPAPEAPEGAALPLQPLASIEDLQAARTEATLDQSAPPAAAADGPVEGKARPNIAVGSWVSWGNQVGRVDLIVTDGKVPGVDDDVTGSKDRPAARVAVWSGNRLGGKVGVPVSKLKGTFPRSQKKDASPIEALVATAAAAGVDAAAVKSAYERGLAGWPGYEKTRLTPEGWAMGRAAHLLQAARDPQVKSHDRDLLNGGLRPLGRTSS